MSLAELIDLIYKWVLQFMPLFRIAWSGIVVLGIAMLIIAVILKKNPTRKKSPWIIGGIALLMVISSGTQLVASFL
ncbi:hypothetical protein [Blautia producta]|uniref:hypothetical protein n=1 Tax=Blautia producta TaxID=33035 RepID=UPI003562724F